MEIAEAQGCVVCGPGETRSHVVPEAMFGTGESFDYLECLQCGSLQIREVPSNLGDYYDTRSYYSFNDARVIGKRWESSAAVRAAWRAQTHMYLATGRGRGVPWTRIVRPRVDARILDLGCGSGTELMRLRKFGFRCLAGSDPFATAEGEIYPGIPLFRRLHGEIDGEYDVITMSHSFEHVPDPRSTLRSVHRLLAHEGRAVVRMPVMGTRAWSTYGTRWVQIDAPRHLILFTRAGFERLAAEEGFRIEEIVFDSGAFQFWGSELVSAGIPHAGGPQGFTDEQMLNWRESAHRLNRQGFGDQAMYVLARA